MLQLSRAKPGNPASVYIMYFSEILFAIFSLYFTHADIGYECIVFSCIVEISILTHFLTSYININTRLQCVVSAA